jgi:hypothetical protein
MKTYDDPAPSIYIVIHRGYVLFMGVPLRSTTASSLSGHHRSGLYAGNLQIILSNTATVTDGGIGKECAKMLLAAFEILLLVFILLLLLTQILLPMMRGMPVFPFFRNAARLNNKLDEVRQKAAEKKLKEEIDDFKRKEGV